MDKTSNSSALCAVNVRRAPVLKIHRLHIINERGHLSLHFRESNVPMYLTNEKCVVPTSTRFGHWCISFFQYIYIGRKKWKNNIWRKKWKKNFLKKTVLNQKTLFLLKTIVLCTEIYKAFCRYFV